MERLKRNFYSLGYYCTPNLSIHQNSTQKLTWNFLVTLSDMLYLVMYCTFNFCPYQTSQEGIRCTKGKEYEIRSYCPNIYIL